ncbi:MAG TPA: nitroreductase family deazaflavin-dependent oxidoreductase [Mycobacteriales bacterium]|nr:nitroreductase family deazaflavin-dependent oxidoreductase [Mycobacteriales bacterium]
MSATDTLQSIGLRVHQRIYEGTGGAIGHRLIGVPSLLLRTTGRKTGLTRTNALVYARDGDSYLVVPSNGGEDRPPSWLANLRAHPDVEIQIGRRSMPATARVVERGDTEYARLWESVNSNNHHRYEAYQKKTARPIPVVAIRPSSSPLN